MSAAEQPPDIGHTGEDDEMRPSKIVVIAGMFFAVGPGFARAALSFHGQTGTDIPGIVMDDPPIPIEHEAPVGTPPCVDVDEVRRKVDAAGGSLAYILLGPQASKTSDKVLPRRVGPASGPNDMEPPLGTAEMREGATSEAADPTVGICDFEDIFTRFQSPLIYFIYRMVGNREQAYDLTQDVFVKAYRAFSTGTEIQAAALSSWLYRIAINTATDALRRRSLINWLPLSAFSDDRGVGAGVTQDVELNSASVSPNGHAIGPSLAHDGNRFESGVADREILEAVFRRMPAKDVTALLLYEHEGLSCAEIAEVMNVSLSAIKMRLMRARERFIALYNEEMGEG